MSKSSGNALDFTKRSRSSLVRRFNFARLRQLVSKKQLGGRWLSLTYSGTRPVPDEDLGRGLLLTDVPAA